MDFYLSDKQPSETLQDRYADFKNLLLAGETITAATVTVSGSTATVDNVLYAGTVVTFDVIGGTHTDTAKFTIKVTGSLGSIRERELLMRIIES